MFEGVQAEDILQNGYARGSHESVKKRNAEIRRRALREKAERDGTCTTVPLSNVIDLFVTDVSWHRGSGEITRRTSSQFSLENQERAWYGRTRETYT